MFKYQYSNKLIKLIAVSCLFMSTQSQSGVFKPLVNAANSVGSEISGTFSPAANFISDGLGKISLVDPFKDSKFANSALLLGDKNTLIKMPTLELDGIAKGYGLSDANLGSAWTNFRDISVESYASTGNAVSYAAQETYKNALDNLNDAFSLCVWAAKNSQFIMSPALIAYSQTSGQNINLIDREEAYTVCSNTGLGMLTNLANSLDSNLEMFKKLNKYINGNKDKILEDALAELLNQTKNARQLLNAPFVKHLINNKKVSKLEKELAYEPFDSYSSIDDLRANIFEENFSYHNNPSTACARVNLPIVCDNDGSTINQKIENLIYSSIPNESTKWKYKRVLHAILTHAYGPSYWYQSNDFSNELRDNLLEQYSNYLDGSQLIDTVSGVDPRIPYIVDDSLLSGGMGLIISSDNDYIILLNEKLFAAGYDGLDLDFTSAIDDQNIDNAKLVYLEELFHLMDKDFCNQNSTTSMCLVTNDAGAMAADAIEQLANSSNWDNFLIKMYDNTELQSEAGTHTMALIDENIEIESNMNIWSIQTWLKTKKTKIRMRTRTGLSVSNNATASTVVFDLNVDFPYWVTRNTGLGDYYDVDTVDDCKDYHCKALVINVNVGIRDEVEVGISTDDYVEAKYKPENAFALSAAAGTSRVHQVKFPFVLKGGDPTKYSSSVTKDKMTYEYANGFWGYGAVRTPKPIISNVTFQSNAYAVPWADMSAEWSIRAKNAIGVAQGVGGVGAVGGCAIGSMTGMFMSKALEGCVLGSHAAESASVFSIAANQSSAYKWVGWGMIYGITILDASAGPVSSNLRLEVVQTVHGQKGYK